MTVVPIPKRKSPHLRSAGGFVYFLRSGDVVKIGFSTDPEVRAKAIGNMNPLGLDMVGLHPGTRLDEAILHERFSGHRRHGEWFDWCQDIENAARDGFVPALIEEASDEAVIGAVVIPVFRKRFPHRAASELQKRTGYSARMCEYWLSLYHEIPSQALVALILSDVGSEILSALQSSNSNFVK